MKLSLKKIKNGLLVYRIMAESDNLPQHRKDYWMNRGLGFAECLHDCQAIEAADYYEYRANIRAAAAKPTNCLETPEDDNNLFAVQDAVNVN